jgi:hypothetical protein
MTVNVPGAFVYHPEDFGLLAGNYAVFSFNSKEVELLNMNLSGTLQPDKLGQPDLPFIRFHVQLPSSVTGDQVKIEVIPASFTPLEGEYSVAPVQVQLPESFTPGVDVDSRVFQRNQEIYTKDAYFSHAMEYELSNLHGMKILEIRYSPLQYNPVQKKILAAGSVRIVVSYPSSATDASKGNFFEQVVRNSTFDGIGGLLRQNDPYIAPEQKGGKVVVISAQKMLSTKTFEDWVSYRKERGYEIVEKIDVAVTPDIKTKVKALYTASKFDFVVVIGDETVVPIPTTNTTGYYYKDLSRLDGTDNLEDVGLGIFLCDDEAKLQNIVQHQKWQEAGGEWNKTQLSASGAEVSAGTWNRFSTGHAGTVHLDNPSGGLGFKVKRVYNVPSIPTKYGGSNIGLPIVPFEAWVLNPTPFYTVATAATDALVKFWNEGIVNISHRDHGSPSGTSAPPIKGTLFSTGKITSTCSPYFTSLNCLTGAFKGAHATNLAYQASTAKYGVCTEVGATVVTMSGDNDGLHMGMYAAMYPKDGKVPITNVGKIWLQGHIKGQTHSRTYFHNWGDPLTTLSLGGSTAINTNTFDKPVTALNFQCYGSKIMLQIPNNAGPVSVSIYNLQGKSVRTLANGILPAGVHSISLDKPNNNKALASGIYLVKMEAAGFMKTTNLLIRN